MTSLGYPVQSFLCREFTYTCTCKVTVVEQVEYDLLYDYMYIRKGNFPHIITKIGKTLFVMQKSKNFVVKEDGLLYFRNKKNLDLKEDVSIYCYNFSIYLCIQIVNRCLPSSDKWIG